MFQSSHKRLRAWLSRFDDILGDPPADARPAPESADPGAHHPHRRPLRWQRDRRPGGVAPAPAVCLCPVRSGRKTGAGERAMR
jgi:hypothetical protein